MALDPNWFYSSLAQAAAAIVGIVGGFVLTAVLRHREQAATRRTQLAQDGKQMSSSVHDLASAHRQFVDWFDESIAPLLNSGEIGTHALPKVVMLRGGVYDGGDLLIGSGDFDLLRRMRKVAGRWSVLLGGMDKTTALLQTKRVERRRLVEELETAIHELFSIDEAWRAAHPGGNVGQIAAGSSVLVSNARDRMREYFAKLGVAEREAVPRTLYAAVLLLGFLATVGVIIPLTQLSAFETAHKIWLTASFGAGLAALLGFVLNEVRRVRAMSRLKEADLDEPHFFDSLV